MGLVTSSGSASRLAIEADGPAHFVHQLCSTFSANVDSSYQTVGTPLCLNGQTRAKHRLLSVLGKVIPVSVPKHGWDECVGEAQLQHRFLYNTIKAAKVEASRSAVKRPISSIDQCGSNLLSSQ